MIAALQFLCKMPKLRVLFIVPSLKRAGAERQLLDLVNALPAADFEKYVLTYRANDGLEKELDQDDVTLHELSRKARIDLSLGRQIGHLIDQYQIDVVHCTLQNAMLYGLMGRYFAESLPAVVVAIHTTKNPDLKHDIADSLIYRPMLRRCDDVWFVSQVQAETWLAKMRFLREQSRVVHNGINLNHYDPVEAHFAGRKLRESLGIGVDENVVCSVAGLRPEKLHNVLIDALARVIAGGVPCRLLLVGTGPTEPQLRDQVDSLGLQSNVLFLGATDDVRPALAAADAMALVSAAETFSMAMLEAMAMELPVITTVVGGASEAIVSGQNGFLVSPNDPQELATIITSLFSDAPLRESVGRRARTTVVDRFALSTMARNSARYLREIPARNKD